jgi:hypothetical protein
MPDRRLAWLILAAVCTLLAPRSSSAATWETNGAPLAPTDSVQIGPIVVSDGTGGAYVAWREYRNGWGLYLLRLMSNGAPSPGWPASGRLLGGGYEEPVMVADGTRGAFIAATTRTSHAWWYVDAGGTVSQNVLPDPAVAHPADIQKSDPDGLAFLLADGGGGAFLGWTRGGRLDHDVRVLHLSPTGLAQGWPGDIGVGFGLGGSFCSDDSGGVIVAWWPSGIVTRRVRVDGTYDPNWPPYSAIPGQSDADAPALVSDNAGGALVFWLDRRSGIAQVYAQHLTSTNTIAAGWPGEGLRISPGASEAGTFRYYNNNFLVRYSSVAPDGAGGGFVAWSEARNDTSDIFVQHVLPDGSLAPGWPADGLAVCAAAGTQVLPTIAADGAGGVLVSWQDHRSGTEWDVYAQHVGGDGTTAWAANGVQICGSAGDQLYPGVAPDGAGGGILGWQDARCGTPQIFGSHVLADGSLPSGSELTSIAVAATDAHADSGTIGITWSVTKGTLGSLPAHVYRQVDGTWKPSGANATNDGGVLHYSDTGLIEGCTFGYALGIVNCGTEQLMGQTWVTTPLGHGFTTLATLSQGARADSGHVRLHWQLQGGTGVLCTLSRRDSCTDWATVGAALPDADGQIQYFDAGPFFVGQHLVYRLTGRACGADRDLGTLDLDPATTDFVPLQVSFRSARADTVTASLTWEETVGPPATGYVFRRDSVESWSLRGAVIPRVREFQFGDTGLRPGHRYEYRLMITGCGERAWSEVTAIATPVSNAPPVQIEAHPQFGLRAVRPNPASTQLAVDVALENDRPAMLEMLDPSGRRVLLRDVGGLGSGLHSFPLDGIPGLRSGVYLLRLSQDGHSSTRRVTIVH